jgi:hypothetical protein
MVILYSTNCPRCRIIEKKLQDKGIKFELFNDVDAMIAKGFKEAPKLEVDGTIMDFKKANEWIKGQ